MARFIETDNIIRTVDGRWKGTKHKKIILMQRLDEKGNSEGICISGVNKRFISEKIDFIESILD